MNGGYFPPGGGGGSFDPHSPGPIGDVTPGTGSFSTLAATGNISGSTGTFSGNLTLGNTTSTPTASPITLSSGGTFADAPTAGKAKWKLYDNGTPIDTYGIGISNGQFDFFVAVGSSYKWHINDVECLALSPNNLFVRNGTAGQTFGVYATFTDGSNYSRFLIDATGSGSILKLSIDEAGSGIGALSGTVTDPGSSSVVTFVPALSYGTDQNYVMTKPSRWLDFSINGSDYKIPLYV